MQTYIVTFRIALTGDDDARREALIASILQGSSRHWDEPTSFLLVETEDSLDDLASWASQSIDPAVDIVLIRALDQKSARVIGRVEDRDLFELMPYCKRL